MGFFSSSKQVAVSSVTYSLAGNGHEVDYIRQTVTGQTLLEGKATYGEAITNSLINGPGMRMRAFYRWAVSSGYTSLLGLPTGSLIGEDDIDEDDLAAEIPHGVTETVVLNSVTISFANITYWADEYMLANHPDLIEESYTASINPDGTSITITMDEDPDEQYVAPLVGYSPTGRYLFINYQIKSLIGTLGPIKLILYLYGSGNSVFDAFFSAGTPYGTYLPIIPVRADSRFIGDDYLSVLYPMVKKAMRKALPAGNFDKLVKDLVANNDSIGDVNYANIMFGVSLNTKSQAGKRYIYEFFSQVYARTGGAQSSVSIQTSSPYIYSNIRVLWTALSKSVSNGVVFSGAEIGDVSFTYVSTNSILMNRQISAIQFESIFGYGLIHQNMVYEYLDVLTPSGEALLSTDESAFIVPIDVAVLNQLSLVEANQLSNYMGYMVFNSYKETERRWYEGGLLNLVVIIVVVAVTVSTAGSGTGASAGLLGSSTSIGIALGFSGTLALLVGTLANAIASMILIKIMQAASTALFGEKVGTIIGTIAGIIAVSYGTAYMNGQSMASVASELANPENLMRLTSSVGDSYTSYLQASTTQAGLELSALQSESDKLLKQIAQFTEENLSTGLDYINPLSFTEAISAASESPEAFLTRTLLTGTDIAQLGLTMLENYASITLDTTLPSLG